MSVGAFCYASACLDVAETLEEASHRMRILHRYILRELLKALALALPAITGVFCFAIVLQALQSRGLGPVASARFMVLSAPGALYVALPLSAVLVVTLIYGRLAADNEVMACRASGIPVSSLLWPSLLLALIATGLTLGLASWPLPESTYAAKKISLEYAENLFFSQLQNGKIAVREAGFQMTVDRLVGNQLYGVTLLHRGLNGQVTYVYAPVGRAEFDNVHRQVTLTLRDSLGEIVRPESPRAAATGTAAVTATAVAPAASPKEKLPAAAPKDKAATPKDKAPAAKGKTGAAAPGSKAAPKAAPKAPPPTGFVSTPIQGDHIITFDLPDFIPRRSDDLSLWQLMAVQHNPMLAEEVAEWPETAPPQVRQAALDGIRARAIASLHGRLATAMGCLGLVLLGAGLGMRFNSGNLLTAFGLAMGPWLIAYVLTQMVGVKAVGENLGDPQKLVWIIWAPNLLLLALGAAAVAGIIWVWGHPVRLRHRLLGRSAAPAAAAPAEP